MAKTLDCGCEEMRPEDHAPGCAGNHYPHDECETDSPAVMGPDATWFPPRSYFADMQGHVTFLAPASLSPFTRRALARELPGKVVA